MGLRLHVICGNASYNRGDRINLLSQIALLHRHFPGCHISVETFTPKEDRQRYQASFVSRRRLFSLARWRAVWGADAVIWGGGGLVVDSSCRTMVPYWLVSLLPAYLCRKPIMAWAHGVVLETALGRMFARLLYKHAALITVRDVYSEQLIRSLGVGNVILTADSAVLIPSASKDASRAVLARAGVEDRGRFLAGIAPTFWAFCHHRNLLLPPACRRVTVLSKEACESFMQNIVLIADALIEKYDGEVIFLPHYTDSAWPDLDLIRQIIARCRYKERCKLLSEDQVAPADYRALYQRLDLLVSNALHDSILAVASGVCCAHFYYEEKGVQFFRRVKAERFALDWQVLLEKDGFAAGWAHVDFVLREWGAAKRQVSSAVEALQGEAWRNAVVLGEFLKTQGVNCHLDAVESKCHREAPNN